MYWYARQISNYTKHDIKTTEPMKMKQKERNTLNLKQRSYKMCSGHWLENTSVISIGHG